MMNRSGLRYTVRMISAEPNRRHKSTLPQTLHGTFRIECVSGFDKGTTRWKSVEAGISFDE